MRRLLILLLVLSSHSLWAQLLVEKQQFEMDEFVTFGGKTIKKVKVGWESYGKLNDQKDNVILITHYFTGNSHAAGKYAETDEQAGYWDVIIGPGKAIDTDRFFVISVDSLANLSVHNSHVITTGPASIDPATNKPYGLTFPVVTIRDFVNVQKHLLDSLGIDKLFAVVGPSMGSMQAIDWAAAYPERVERVVSVIGAAHSDAWTTALLEQWAIPIRLDPNWRQGNYYDSAAPIEGLTASLMAITQDALHPEFFSRIGQQTLDYQPVESAPLNDIRQSHSIVNWLRSRAAARAVSMDANHLLYLVRACQLFVAGHNSSLEQGLKAIQAKTLFLPASNDLLLMPHLAQQANHIMQKQGKASSLELLPGELGHLEGVTGIEKHGSKIKTFLEHDL